MDAGGTQQVTVEPPVFEERRRLPDRRRPVDPRGEEPTRLLHGATAAGVATCGGLVCLYVFFAAIGAFDFSAAVVATIVVVVMFVVWLVAYWYRLRTAEPRAPAVFERERRGF